MLALGLALALASSPVMPHAVGVTRGGLPLVVVSAPASPWAEVQLHLALDPTELAPAERARLSELASSLAALPDLSAVGGLARARVAPDHLVLSWGAPASQLDLLLRAAHDTILRHRTVKQAARPVVLAQSSEHDLDARALELAMAGTPLMLPVTQPAALPAGAATAAPLGPLAARVLRRERVALAVVGPLAEAELLERASRALGASLPPGAIAAEAAIAPATGIRLAELADGDVEGARSTLWLIGLGRGSVGAQASDRAARAVLARLLGGRAQSSPLLFAIAIDVTSPRAATIVRAEGKLLDALEGVARTPPPADVVTAEAARERAARLERLRDVEAIGDALGRALLAGNAGLLESELAALQTVTPEQVAAAARAVAMGPRVIWRVVGTSR